MGICDSCCKPSQAQSTASYEEIPKAPETAKLTNSKQQSYQNGTELPPSFHSTAGEKQDAKNAADFDLTSSVFEGLEVQQKFTNKSTYDTRCVLTCMVCV